MCCTEQLFAKGHAYYQGSGVCCAGSLLQGLTAMLACMQVQYPNILTLAIMLLAAWLTVSTWTSGNAFAIITLLSQGIIGITTRLCHGWHILHGCMAAACICPGKRSSPSLAG